MPVDILLANLKSTGVFVIVLSVLILVHEWGHFFAARRSGVKVERFSLGFGPKLFSKIYQGTEYLICLIPLGGYVKMAGDERSECKGAPDEFLSQSAGKRSLIVFSGPLVNFILAYVCFVFVFMLGYPDLSTKVGGLIENYPAQMAGLQIGDHIKAVNEISVSSWTQLQKNIKEANAEKITLKVLRNKEELFLTLYPKIEDRKNIFGQKQKMQLIGIRPKEEIVLLKYSWGESFIKSYEKLAEIVVMTYKSLYFMITGSMPLKDSVTGPIGIFFIIKSAAEMGLNHVLFILGVISASLAIFNLLPVIPLDGGHILLLAVEKIRGRILSEKTEEWIARVGFSLIMALAAFVFYSDFARFGWIDKIKNLFH
ncbi:MAG TPA: RIP metalloprotease RseP [Candidatus Omnitrophota bacterium]|nr:RIP metalloprotease RseP [Candidatus Omnitrophota bacterium]HPN88606.1 RIP metalloprotease RseP [Candidatus Omnitrophota bacterium]